MGSGWPSTLARMSASTEPDLSADGRDPDDTPRAAEAIDALPVLAEQVRVVRAPSRGALAGDGRPAAAMLPAVQAAAVAAGGFVAGAAVVGLVSRRHRSRVAARKSRRAGRDVTRGGRRSAGELVQILGSRSFLVDVHLLGASDGHDG